VQIQPSIIRLYALQQLGECASNGFACRNWRRNAKARKDEEAAIAYVTEAIATLKDEIAAFTASIAALDQAVAGATELRKAEHAACAATMATDMT